MKLHQTKKLIAQQRKPSAKWKGKLPNKRICLKNISLIRGWYSKYMNNSYTSTPTQTKTTWLKHGQRRWTDIFAKKIYRWPTGIWKEIKPLIIMEMLVKTTMSYHWMLIRMSIITKHKKYMLVRMWRKENPYTLGV